MTSPSPARLAAHTLARPLASLLVLAGLCGAQAVLPGDMVFSTWQEVIDAAAPGDIVLIQAPPEGITYFETLTITGKGITIIGEGDVTFTTIPLFVPGSPLVVRNVPEGQSMVVRGIDFQSTGADPITAAVVEDCEGPVVLEDCRLLPAPGIALYVDDCVSVVVSRCDVLGGGGTFASWGTRIDDSEVFFHGSTIRGGTGNDAFQEILQPVTRPSDGATAAYVRGRSEVLVSGGAILGGSGGNGDTGGFCYAGRDGGDGLWLQTTGEGAPKVRTRDVTISAGAAGSGGCGQPDGTPGAPLDTAGGTHIVLPDSARSYYASAPVVAGDSVTLNFFGVTGDTVLLLLAPTVVPGNFFQQSGVDLHLSIPFADAPLGVLAGLPFLQLSLTVPTVPPAAEGITLASQALFTAPGGQRFMGGPSIGVFLQP